jgi:GNAT superfamily N-acetyltransferase
VWVAEVVGTGAAAVLVGFVAIELHHPEREMGEISILGVDPDYQGSGIGSALPEFALERLEDSGMRVAMVGTGGDPGHAAAHLREGRLHPSADSQVLQEPIEPIAKGGRGVLPAK